MPQQKNQEIVREFLYPERYHLNQKKVEEEEEEEEEEELYLFDDHHSFWTLRRNKTIKRHSCQKKILKNVRDDRCIDLLIKHPVFVNLMHEFFIYYCAKGNLATVIQKGFHFRIIKEIVNAEEEKSFRRINLIDRYYTPGLPFYYNHFPFTAALFREDFDLIYYLLRHPQLNFLTFLMEKNKKRHHEDFFVNVIDNQIINKENKEQFETLKKEIIIEMERKEERKRMQETQPEISKKDLKERIEFLLEEEEENVRGVFSVIINARTMGIWKSFL